MSAWMTAARPALALRERALPAGTLALAVLVDLLPLPRPAPDALAPLVSLATLLAWALLRPDRIGPVLAFATGLALDLGGGLPPGATGLPFLLAQQLAAGGRGALQDLPPLGQWAVALPLAAGACLLRWLLLSLSYGSILPLRPGLFELALTIALYPVVAVLVAQSGQPRALRHAPRR